MTVGIFVKKISNILNRIRLLYIYSLYFKKFVETEYIGQNEWKAINKLQIYNCNK